MHLRQLPMPSTAQTRFEAVVSPHLDAAYTLARYLTRDDDGARDIVQDACLRALRFFGGFRGDNGRAWLLAIVRSRCAEWFRERGRDGLLVEFDETAHSPEIGAPSGGLDDHESLQAAVDALPPVLREVIVLREVLDLSYREIAGVTGVPVGTVMSRLSRARDRLRLTLAHLAKEGGGR
jgi:RNA polymerase sigma factor (sigma-70 family)